MHTQNLQVLATDTSHALASGACRIFWHSFREVTGAAGAVYKLTDGNAPGAKILLTVSLNTNESTRDWFGTHGLEAEDSVYFLLVSGQVEGNVQTVLEDEYQADVARVMSALNQGISAI